jgi:hypothetical protein
MSKTRVLVLDEKTETALSMICDVALKFAGIHMASIVTDLACAIRDRSEDGKDDDEW